jgi:hypothetical protein
MRLAGAATVAAGLSFLAPVPASAGGPTSVLLASPSTQHATALYYSDADYQRLAGFVGDTVSPDKDAPNLSNGMASVNITWLIHDVQIWRIDRVFMPGGGEPWIETRMSYDAGAVIEAKPVMHRPTNAKAFVAMLTELELIGSGSGKPRAAAADAAPAPPPATPAGNQPVGNAAAESEPASIDWLWLLIGAAAGAMLVIAFRPLVVRRRVPN